MLVAYLFYYIHDHDRQKYKQAFKVNPHCKVANIDEKIFFSSQKLRSHLSTETVKKFFNTNANQFVVDK